MSKPSTTLNWQPGGAQGNTDFLFVDGNQYLMAVRVCHSEDKKMRLPLNQRERQWWDFAVVTARVDEDYFALECEGEPWGWDWDSVEWFVEMSQVALPYVHERVGDDA